MKNFLAISCVLASLLTLAMPMASAASQVSYQGATINLVTLPSSGIVGEVVTSNGSVVEDESATTLVNSSGSDTVAAINGLFFNSYYTASSAMSFPDNCPLILTTVVQDGQAISVSGDCNGLIMYPDGTTTIDKVNVTVRAFVNDNSAGASVWTVNGANTQSDAIIYITDEMTLPYTVGSGASAFLISNGVTTDSYSSGQTVTLSAGQELLVFNSGAYTSHSGWSMVPSIGDSVRFTTTITTSSGATISETVDLVGGGRMLIHNGQNVNTNTSYNSALDGEKQDATSVLQRSFVAIGADGSVILGTAYTSFANIADYLMSIGVVHAMSLDGGASSMLYENGGYVTSASRELASIITFSTTETTTTTTEPTTADPITAIATSSVVYVDGTLYDFPTYNIEGNNYVKLRDLAYVMDGTAKEFEVNYDSVTQLVSLESGQGYTALNTEMTAISEDTTTTILPGASEILVDGTSHSPTAYNINDNNFVKLRDIGEIFDFSVEWDNDLRAVIIDSSLGYTPEG